MLAEAGDVAGRGQLARESQRFNFDVDRFEREMSERGRQFDLSHSLNEDRMDMAREQFDEDVRRFGLKHALEQSRFGLQEQQFEEGKRQFGLGHGLREDQFAEQQRQFGLGHELREDQFAEQQRQFDAGFGENQRQFDAGFGLRQDQFGEQQRQFNLGFGENQRQFNIGDWMNRMKFREGQREFNLGLQQNYDQLAMRRQAEEANRADRYNLAGINQANRMQQIGYSGQLAQQGRDQQAQQHDQTWHRNLLAGQMQRDYTALYKDRPNMSSSQFAEGMQKLGEYYGGMGMPTPFNMERPPSPAEQWVEGVNAGGQQRAYLGSDGSPQFYPDEIHRMELEKAQAGHQNALAVANATAGNRAAVAQKKFHETVGGSLYRNLQSATRKAPAAVEAAREKQRVAGRALVDIGAVYQDGVGWTPPPPPDPQEVAAQMPNAAAAIKNLENYGGLVESYNAAAAAVDGVAGGLLGEWEAEAIDAIRNKRYPWVTLDAEGWRKMTGYLYSATPPEFVIGVDPSTGRPIKLLEASSMPLGAMRN